METLPHHTTPGLFFLFNLILAAAYWHFNRRNTTSRAKELYKTVVISSRLVGGRTGVRCTSRLLTMFFFLHSKQKNNENRR
jgi:hypothetical protein